MSDKRPTQYSRRRAFLEALGRTPLREILDAPCPHASTRKRCSQCQRKAAEARWGLP